MDDPPPNAVVSENRVRCAIDVTAAAWLLQAADVAGARRLLESALVAAPHDVRARSLLGQVLFRQRDFVGASEVFERLIAEFPGDVPLLFNLALCHLKGGRPGPAAATLRQILKLRPEHARARAWLRVAEAATPAPPGVATVSDPPPAEPATHAPSRTSTRPARLEEVPKVSLPPGTLVAKDDSGVVSLRVDDETRWVVRRSTLEGYSGEVAQSPAGHGAGFVALSGEGTALLRAPGSLVVLELRDEETGARASALAAYAKQLGAEVADPDVVGDFGETILRLSGRGPVVLEARAELTALPVSLTHATTVRWDHVVGWTGHVIGAPSSQVDADGRTLARFAGSGSLLLAMHEEAAPAALPSYGRCEVIRRLGGGPRDEILLARSVGPGGFRRKVVLERRLVGGDDGRPIERLAHEAHAYALLAHPCIARLFDFLLIDGHPVIVREYVSGVSLAELVTAAGDRDGDVQASIAFHVAHAIFSGLAAAHEACDPDTGDVVPLVHGDVRTGCVLVGWNGEVKLAGFAAARLDGGKPPAMRNDVRAAARLLVDMLASRKAIDAARTEVELRDAIARIPLEPVRADKRQALRDALLAAIVPRASQATGGPRARELVEAIADGVDLSLARDLCVDVLGVLRERQGGAALSSMPPPVVDPDDSVFFHHRALPKPSPVPVVEGDAPSAEIALAEVARAESARDDAALVDAANADAELVDAERVEMAPLRVMRAATPVEDEVTVAEIESYATPPPVQPPSIDPAPRPSMFPEGSARRRRLALAIAAGVVALASGVASIDGARSSPIEDSPMGSPAAAAAPIAIPAPPAPIATPTREAPVAPVPPPTAVETAVPDAAAAAAITPDAGVLRAPIRARQHRVFVDGRVVGEGEGDYVVSCGAHVVRVGSQGEERKVDVPCGATVDLD